MPCPVEIELTNIDNQSAAFGLSLAKTTNITGFNDIAATAIVSAGAITTLSGAVITVTSVTNGVTVTTNSDKTGYSVLLTQTLSAARDVTAITDTSLTLNDAFHGAVASVGGQQTVVSTTYTTKTSAGTVLRIFTLDSSTSPTSRT